MSFWPSAVATTLQLLQAVNNTKVLLNVDCGIGDTTITVDDASPLPASGYLTFDDNADSPETIHYTGISGHDLTGVTRGVDSTSAATHSASASPATGLEQRWNAAYHNTLTAELVAVEQNLSDRFGTGSTAIAVPSGVTFTLAKTSNQIILGTTRTVTITAPTPASVSRIWTIPDITADGTFASLNGTQTFTGTKTFSTSVTLAGATSSVTVALTGTAVLTIAATTNQIIFGTTNTTTVSAAAPASSAVYTIPDVGTTANFIMSAGTQTVGGAKTFSTAVTINPVTNQIVLGTTNTVTINSVAPSGSRTYTIPDAGGAASFMLTAGAYTVTGTWTNVTLVTPTLGAASATSLTFTSTSGIIGTTTNNNAATGSVGEIISSAVTSVSAATSTQYADIASIALTAGDWDVSALFVLVQNGGTLTGVATVFLGQVSGNNTTGLALGDNCVNFIPPNASNSQSASAIPSWRLSLSGSVTIYLKGQAAYTVATPLWNGRISARRMR
jgi:hypothetical protein